MNILIMGSGGREDVIAWKLAQSERVKQLYALPGNPGMAKYCICIDQPMSDFDLLTELCHKKQIDLVVVGPEVPLCQGVVDHLTAANIKAFGPTAKSAQLEGSKEFAKKFMNKYAIPTAKYRAFSDAKAAKQSLAEYGLPVVIKADGLAAGKGVVIARTPNQAEAAIDQMLTQHKFGEAGQQLLLEEYLTGTEASLVCFVDEMTILPMASSQDYKRAWDDDRGPNTGGMGNYSPNRLFDEALKQTINQTILQPLLAGLQAEGLTYNGWLFIGLMIDKGMPKVIEFNVRFGDPEAECLLPRMENDLLEVIEDAMQNRLVNTELQWRPQSSCTLILTSAGYPEKYQIGYPIEGLAQLEDVLLFHCGTAQQSGTLVSNGGRVLALTALAQTLSEARHKVYREAAKIKFTGKTMRHDIAK